MENQEENCTVKEEVGTFFLNYNLKFLIKFYAEISIMPFCRIHCSSAKCNESVLVSHFFETLIFMKSSSEYCNSKTCQQSEPGDQNIK